MPPATLVVHLFVCIIIIIITAIYSRHIQDTDPNPEVGPRHRNFKSVGERLACEALETRLGREIIVNSRPQHLRNPKTGRCLEYDGYDPITKTAIDYNGPQHYEWPNRYHRTEDDFKDQLERDKLKVQLSEKAGIRLICIPYTVDCPAKNTYPSHDVRYARILAYLESKGI